MKNIAMAIILQLVTALLSFVTRTLLIKSLGIDAVSINGLFTEVITILSLTELGVGAAIIYNLYKPLAEGDEEKICRLMLLFKKAYRIIALATLVIGLALIPVITLLVNEVNYPDSYVRTVYALFVVQTAASYLFSYKVSLLTADQRNYIYSIIQVVVKLVSTAVCAAVLFTTYNYIAYLVTVIIFSLATNIAASAVTDKLYPYLREDHGSLRKDERKQVFSNIKNLFVKNVSSRITNSTDNILISALIGTLTVGLYSNYSLILNLIRQLANQISGALAGSLGNLFASEDKKYCSEVLNRLTFIFYMAASALATCLFCCITPFIELWIGEEWVLADAVVFICCFNAFIDFAKIPLWQSLEVSGLFKKDRNIAIAGSCVNLLISIVLGLTWGISGIFLGTLATYVIQLVLKIRLLYSDFFALKSGKYYLSWALYALLAAAQMAAAKLICNLFIPFGKIAGFIVTALIGAFLSLAVNFLIFGRSARMKYALSLIKKFTGFRHKDTQA